MKKVLMVAYFWPPDNAAGTHRPLRFVRHLREFNWEPVVLTAVPIRYTRYDPGLVNRVPEGIRIIRAPHHDLWLSFQNWRGKRINQISSSKDLRNNLSNKYSFDNLFNWKAQARNFVRWVEPQIYHPDHFMGWINSAVSVAENHFKSGNGLDAIWATGGPWSDFEVGYQLSKRWNLPLILDFRDGWTITYNDFEDRRPSWARKWDKWRLEHYFQQSKSVVFLTETFAECYLTLYGSKLDAKKIYIIPNGFEFEPIEKVSENSNKLTILYTGVLAPSRYDTFFQALTNLLSRGEIKNIDITFVGEDEPEARLLVNNQILSEHIHFLPVQPYETTRRIMKRANVLLLFGNKPTRGMELFVTSKIFHYWGMGRPVIGILPDDEARKVMLQAGSELVADVDSIKQIENILLKLYHAWEKQLLEKYIISAQKIQYYAEPNLSRALVDALECRIPKNPFQPGKTSVPQNLLETLKK